MDLQKSTDEKHMISIYCSPPLSMISSIHYRVITFPDPLRIRCTGRIWRNGQIAPAGIDEMSEESHRIQILRIQPVDAILMPFLSPLIAILTTKIAHFVKHVNRAKLGPDAFYNIFKAH